MSPPLKSGSITLGIGVAGFIGAVNFGTFGPCGSIGAYAAFFLVSAGPILCLAAGIAVIVERRRPPAE
jgi:hypothetical protein